mgnify:CR=1 FL=1
MPFLCPLVCEKSGFCGILRDVAFFDDGRLSEANLRRIREATTADFSFALGVSMTRRLIREYQKLPYDWRKLVTIVPVDNFKQQERIRWGGLGELPDVPESTTQDYPELIFPTEKVQFCRGADASKVEQIIVLKKI